MIRRAVQPLVSLAVVSLIVACSAEDSSKDNGSNATGGVTASGGVTGSGGEISGTGAVAATGGSGGTVGTGGVVGTGATAATGGDAGTGATTGTGGTVGTGGAGTGGGGNPSGFTCPATTAGATPTLGAGATLLATSPNMGGEASVFIEGPVWANGALYVSQIRQYGPPPPARILKLNGTNLEEFIADAGTNGLAVRADGKLVAASHKSRGIITFDLNAPTAAPTLIADKYQNTSFNSPNDLVLRSDGNIYFSDPDYQCGSGCGTKRVYRIDPTGAVSTIASTHNQPNGIALSPDESTLYVAGDGTLEKFPVAADGSVGARSVFAQVSGVDGLGVDCAGNIYTANAPYGKVGVYKPDGSLHGSIDAGGQVTNVAFGGADSKTLYITRYGKELYSITLDIAGYPY
jgi:gluconolactonase